MYDLTNAVCGDNEPSHQSMRKRNNDNDLCLFSKLMAQRYNIHVYTMFTCKVKTANTVNTMIIILVWRPKLT